ncbi:MAG TPA: adenylate/guanylate cyclase domain-containing protein, partial [bacterium]|nr:adenylate/guanylate cyclase domain-containing protein [bacterium]
ILPFIAAIVPLILGWRFMTTGKALPIGLLVLAVLGEVALLVGPPVLKRLRPVWEIAKSAVASLFSSRFARVVALIPTGWRVLIAVGALFVLTTVVPTITIPDLRYASAVLTFFLFFGTIGSLFVTFLRASDSLKRTMRWTALAATAPFLLMYVIVRWDEVAVPLLHGRIPNGHSIADLWNFLIGWGVAVLVSLHLAKILADTLLEPLRDMMVKVSLIEKGDFKSRVDVVSRDEIGALGDAVNRMSEGLAKREVIERAFRRYHDKSVAEKIMAGGEGETHIPSKRMPAVIMFSDIRGFTRMSEKMNPEQVVAILNEYFEKMVAVINANGGHIDKFIGDAIMAYWGVPDPDPEAARRAVNAALGMREEMDKLNEKFLAQGWPKIGVGIGINSGDVVAGSLGSSDRMEYTVIGDVVNTAQRSESNAMAQQILITEPVFKEIGALLDAEALDARIVKGKTEPVYFWAVKGWKDAASAPKVARA